MDRAALADSFFDPGRLAYVIVVAAIFIVLDVTVLDLVGIQTTEQAILQFIVVSVGAYVGLSVVDFATDDGEDD